MKAYGKILLCCASAGLLLTTMVGSLGCSMSETECMSLRSEAFEIINESHTCSNDTDCAGSEWPECPRPVSYKNLERVDPIKAKFDDGACKEPPKECPETPEIYCKQGLCVFRHQAGEQNPTQ